MRDAHKMTRFFKVPYWRACNLATTALKVLQSLCRLQIGEPYVEILRYTALVVSVNVLIPSA